MQDRRRLENSKHAPRTTVVLLVSLLDFYILLPLSLALQSSFAGVLCEHPLPGVCLAVYIFRWPERRRHLNRLRFLLLEHSESKLILESDEIKNIVSAKTEICRLWNPSEELILQKGFYTRTK